MLTRLEMFRASRGIAPGDLVAESGVSRQHLVRMRKGEIEPRRDVIAAVVSALRHITLEDISADDVFELSVEESGAWRGRSRDDRNAQDADLWTRDHAAATKLVNAMSGLPVADWVDFLQDHQATDGVVRALIFEGGRLRNNEPERAGAIFLAAAQTAARLNGLRRQYQQMLTGRALLELASVLCHRGRLAEALSALSEADAEFEGEPYCSKELAVSWLVRGSVLLKTGALEEAERYLRLSVNLFAAFDDVRRIAKVRMIEAGVFLERGDFDAARDRWSSALPVLAAAKDHHTLAVAWLNLGWCDIEQGNATSARVWLNQALDAFTRVGAGIEVLRSKWALARAEALFGDRNEGVRSLIAARDALHARGLLLDAGMVILDLTEAFLLPPQQMVAAFRLCAQLPAFFERAGATREALKATAYLRELAESRRLAREQLQYTRRFVSRSIAGWQQVFVPPAAMTT